MKKLFILFIAVAGFGVSSYAQSTANAPTSATIVAPITITKNTNLHFGNIAINASTGDVVLDPSLSATRTPGGGVTLPAVTGSPTAAKFTVGGEGSYTYAITLPTGDAFKVTNGTPAQDMIVNNFTSTPSGTGALTTGSQIIYVGAKLNIAGSQPAGSYTNGTGFAVTVNYN
jgi:hypothetical protein